MKLTKDIYTTRDVAIIIGMSAEYVRYIIKDGKLPATKFGTSYVITRENLAEYLEYREARKNGKK